MRINKFDQSIRKSNGQLIKQVDKINAYEKYIKENTAKVDFCDHRVIEMEKKLAVFRNEDLYINSDRNYQRLYVQLQDLKKTYEMDLRPKLAKFE